MDDDEQRRNITDEEMDDDEQRRNITDEEMDDDEQRRDITDEEIDEMKSLLFGDPERDFTIAWRDGFQFSRRTCHLKQNLSGPCGLIASVQACVMYELLFGQERIILKDGLIRPTYAKKKKTLATAICSILWRAKSRDHAVVVRKELLDNDSNGKQTAIFEYSLLLDFVCENITWFIQKGGFINFMYSLILTRGVDRIQEDMDSPNSTLIDPDDSYCQQEIINLILIGRAVTNTFDGEVIFGEGDQQMVCRGVTERPRIGFLADIDDGRVVGDFYKNPERPIWVLNGKNHYLVLYGTRRIISDPPLELYYANSLDAHKEYRLHIQPESDANGSNNSNDSEELPSTILCILTRWPNSYTRAEPI